MNDLSSTASAPASSVCNTIATEVLIHVPSRSLDSRCSRCYTHQLFLLVRWWWWWEQRCWVSRTTPGTVSGKSFPFLVGVQVCVLFSGVGLPITIWLFWLEKVRAHLISRAWFQSKTEGVSCVSCHQKSTAVASKISYHDSLVPKVGTLNVRNGGND